MSSISTSRYPSARVDLVYVVDRAIDFLIAASATLLLCVGALFSPGLGTAKVTAGLLMLMFFITVRYEKLHFTREHYLYLVFYLYMLLSMTWTDNKGLALNTLVPAFNFLLSMTIFSTLIVYGRRTIVSLGFFAGMLAAIAGYMILTGYPLRYPSWFSYNANALVFIFSIFLTALLMGFRRFKTPYIIALFFFVGLLISTTSIKANFGVLIGVVFAAVFFYRDSAKLLIRYLVPLVLIASISVYFVLSNELVLAKIDSGLARIALGLEVLQARDDVSGYSAFSSRTSWVSYGLQQWQANPVFGYGVEAFRSDVGITSHTTIVDLLYNSGVIGFALFYMIYLSLLSRVFKAGAHMAVHIRPLIFAAVVCFMATTLSATMHVSSILAAVTGISLGLLQRDRQKSNFAE